MKNNWNPIQFLQKGNKVSRVDWEGLQSDPEYKKNYNWRIDTNNMRVLEDSLINRNTGYAQRIGVLSQVVPESGGSPKPHGNGAYGLVGWRGARAKKLPSNLPGQIHTLMEGIYNNPSSKDWSHGGSGMGIQSGKEMHGFFKKTPVVRKAVNAFMRGYVRPPEEVYQKRQGFAKLLQKHLK